MLETAVSLIRGVIHRSGIQQVKILLSYDWGTLFY